MKIFLVFLNPTPCLPPLAGQALPMTALHSLRNVIKGRGKFFADSLLPKADALGYQYFALTGLKGAFSTFSVWAEALGYYHVALTGFNRSFPIFSVRANPQGYQYFDLTGLKGAL